MTTFLLAEEQPRRKFRKKMGRSWSSVDQGQLEALIATPDEEMRSRVQKAATPAGLYVDFLLQRIADQEEVIERLKVNQSSLSRRLQVLKAVHECFYGATLDDVKRLTQLPHQIVSPRMSECRKLGLIESCGRTRETRAGKQSMVYMVTAEGVRQLESAGVVV